MMSLSPAYGRDYRNKKTLIEDFKADKDFIFHDPLSRWNGKPINRSQILEMGVKSVLVRYHNYRKVANITV